MTPSPAAVDVQVATDEDLREAIDDVPQAAGVSLEELREQAEASRSHRRTPNHLVHVSELVDRLPALRRSPASSPTTSQRFSIGRSLTAPDSAPSFGNPSSASRPRVSKPDLRPELIPLTLGPQGGHRFSLRPTR